ncbi:transposase [Sphingomonas abietis]|uniref:transposase n=1 Tax=Sphingomonas abietis TaxID=3012344 RepID=UPI00389A4D0D
MLPEWSMAPLVEALRVMRGLDMISAVIFMATIGDLGRFETPRQLMAWPPARDAMKPSDDP